MDWTLEENMVNSLIFCATLTSRRSGHTPFVRLQTGVETSDTCAEAVNPPRAPYFCYCRQMK